MTADNREDPRTVYGDIIDLPHWDSPVHPRMSPQERAAVLCVNPFFVREYDSAIRNYPAPSAMKVISMLCEFDYLGKGGDGAALAPDQLLIELTAKILNA